VLNNLKKRRADRGMNQIEVSEIAGINRSYYSDIETGPSVPSVDIAIRIGNALGVVIDPHGLFKKEEETK